jgi:uridylate kinase
MKKVIVLSLGGSLIIPGEINLEYLKDFKRVILKNKDKYKFIIICGGGSIARKYIAALRASGMSETFQSYAGISATRTNARFMSYFFNQDQKRGIPKKTSEVKNYIKKYDIVLCGALEYHPHQTSDSSSAEIAKVFKSDFINLTDVPGLHAKFIPEISWTNFEKMVNKIKFKPGQHFVLDQKASGIIKKNKITTYILGKDMNQLDNLLNGKKFIGTKISE